MRAILIALTLLMLQAGVVNAKPTSAVRIGYVDINRVLNEVNDGKSAVVKLKTDFERKQKQLDKMQTDLKAKKEQFDKRAAMMKPDVKQQKAQELQAEFMQVQDTYMKLQRELMAKEGEIKQGIFGKIRKVVDRIGDRDAYDMILTIGDTVLYHKRHRDITDDVVRAYNKQYAKK
jgi:outer membrane protein